MDFREVVQARHSVRDFRDAAVPDDMIERVLSAATLAPSSMNEQPWKFYVTTGEARGRVVEILAQATTHLREYAEALGPEELEFAGRWYSSLGDAPLVIGVATPSTDQELERINRYLSVGGAIENILLAAVDEGLGACNITASFWVRDDLAELLGVPEGWELVSLIALGFPGSEPPLAPVHEPAAAVHLD